MFESPFVAPDESHLSIFNQRSWIEPQFAGQRKTQFGASRSRFVRVFAPPLRPCCIDYAITQTYAFQTRSEFTCVTLIAQRDSSPFCGLLGESPSSASIIFTIASA